MRLVLVLCLCLLLVAGRRLASGDSNQYVVPVGRYNIDPVDGKYYSSWSGTGGLFRILRVNNGQMTTVSVNMALKNDPTADSSMNYLVGVEINDVLYGKYEGDLSTVNFNNSLTYLFTYP